jgi:hypothetical protein
MANMDFTGVANQQQQIAQQNNAQQTQANRPNQQTPWGSTGWTQDANGNWTQTQSLNPTLQGTLDQQQQNNQSLTNTAGGMTGQIGQAYQNPMDYSGFMAGGDRVNGGQYYNDRAMGAVRDKFNLWNDEQFGTDTAALEQQLFNRGVRPGDEGYDRQLQQLRETQGKLRQSSNLDAILTGGAEGARMQGMDINAGNYNTSQRQHQIAEAIARRNQPLAEYNAVTDAAGGPVQPPEMPTFASAGKTETPNLMDAMKAQYEQRMDNKTRDADLMNTIMKGVGGVQGIGGMLGQAGSAMTTAGSGGGMMGSILSGVGGVASKVGGFLGGLGGAGGTAAAGTAAAGGAAGAGAAGAAGAGAATAGAAGTGAATTAATGAATGGSGIMSGALAAAPWVAAAVVAALVIENNMPKSSPLDGFQVGSMSWDKPQNFDGTKFSPDELNSYFGPAIQKFAETGDAKAALAALPQPQNARQQTMLKGGAKSLFGGTGNPFRQIAKARGFGEGIWTAGNKDKKAMIKALGG